MNVLSLDSENTGKLTYCLEKIEVKHLFFGVKATVSLHSLITYA